MTNHAYDAADVTFSSAGERCAATFYVPRNSSESGPCIVMAGGLSSERHVGSPPYARRFAAAGYRVLCFDYRGWGGSGGSPHHLVSIRQQLKDWAAAVAHARTLPGVDPQQIALWGSSLSGGHVVVTAAHDKRIAAFSAQVPMMDGLAATFLYLRTAGLGASIRLVVLGVLDLLRSFILRTPVYVQVDGQPGQLALMSTPDTRPGVERLLSEAGVSTEPRFATARIALELGRYRPLNHANKIRCPGLIIASKTDSVAPYRAAEATAVAMGHNAQLELCSYGHFEIYQDEGFAFSSSRQLLFYDHVFGRGNRTDSSVPR